MKATKKAQTLLGLMAQIQNMERGKVCKMKDRNHYNHQTWQAGRNTVRYVSREEIQDLEKAIKGYKRFMSLAQQYADEIIRLSRQERDRNSKKRKCSGKTDNARI